MKGGFFLLNGLFQKEQEAVFTLSDLKNRKEGFSEFFRAEENEVLFVETISEHLIASAEAVGLDLSTSLDPQDKVLRRDVSRLLNKNKLYLAAEIEIQIYPSDSMLNIQFNAREVARGFYPLPDQGLLLSIYHDSMEVIGSSPSYSAFCELRWMIARRRNALSAKTNVLVFNKAGHACESVGGSFAYIQNEEVFFPSAETGGYLCAIRQQVRESAALAGFQIKESSIITAGDLLNAEEIFLFDSCNGIRKVIGLQEQRYFNTKTQLIAEQLTRLAKIDKLMKIS
jgi:hypothetical protein